MLAIRTMFHFSLSVVFNFGILVYKRSTAFLSYNIYISVYTEKMESVFVLITIFWVLSNNHKNTGCDINTYAATWMTTWTLDPYSLTKCNVCAFLYKAVALRTTRMLLFNDLDYTI